MAQTAIETDCDDASTTRPVRLFWQRRDGTEIPALTIGEGPIRTEIFDHFGVESVVELAAEVLSGYQRQRRQSVRLGVVAGRGADATYHPEAALLAAVEELDEALAAALIEWYDDIPTLCEDRRRQGDVLLGTLSHDAGVEGHEWVADVDAFIDSLGPGETLEQRLKAAGVWVEPDSVTAGV